MFSRVILYGRNDSHGYNLHKRAAISFNALAEAMFDPDDEILFVDYNTPEDHPTFPEAIHDTLTDKAQEGMRHAAASVPSSMPISSRRSIWSRSSGQSRNIALRRSESEQSLDPLYQYRHAAGAGRVEGQSLSDILGAVPDGSL